MDIILADELVGKNYIMENIQVENKEPLYLNEYIDLKNMKIMEIFCKFERKKLKNNISIDIEYNKKILKKYQSINVDNSDPFLDLNNYIYNIHYYTNITHTKYLKRKYSDIFYENFSNCKNMDNLIINFECDNDIDISIVYTDNNINNVNNIHNYIDDDIFYL
jgi:hypothetical protein